MIEEENRIVTTAETAEDGEHELSLRPKLLGEYIGQEKAKENLKVFIEAARRREEALDHVLLYGPLRDLVKRPWQGSLPMKWA